MTLKDIDPSPDPDDERENIYFIYLFGSGPEAFL